MQNLNHDESYALLEEGLSETMNVVLASGMNKAVDVVAGFKDSKEHFSIVFQQLNGNINLENDKVSDFFGTENPMNLTMTELALTLIWR